MAIKKPARKQAGEKSAVSSAQGISSPASLSTGAEAPAPTVQKPSPLASVDKEKALGFIESVLDTLTFKRVGLIALLTLLGLGILVFYENRKQVVEYLINTSNGDVPKVTTQGGVPWTLSEQSKNELKKLVSSSDLVAFIGISDVDLQKNRRVLTFFHQKDSTLKLPDAATRAINLPQAMFDYDAKNTAQMVAVLSNEFRCDPYRDTINYRYAPDFEAYSPIVCRLAIPPFAGQFVGFVTIGVAQNVPKQNLDAIRLELARIAVSIYLNDVIKRPASDTVVPEQS